MKQLNMTIGELVAILYEEFLKTYGDAEMASMGTALLIDHLLDGVTV